MDERDRHADDGQDSNGVPASEPTPDLAAPEPNAEVSQPSSPLTTDPEHGQGATGNDGVDSFARHVHTYVTEYIKLADQKAAFTFAVASALLCFVFKQSIDKIWLPISVAWSWRVWLKVWPWLGMYALLAMFFLAYGATMACSVVFPNLSDSGKQNCVLAAVWRCCTTFWRWCATLWRWCASFWRGRASLRERLKPTTDGGGVASVTVGRVFFKSIADIEKPETYASAVKELEPDLDTELLHHVHALSEVCTSKYTRLDVSMWLTAIGVALSILLLLLVM